MGKYRLKAKDLRQKDAAELRKMLVDTQQELLTLRQKAIAGTISSPAQIRELRKNVARILTVLNEKAREAAPRSEKQAAK